MGAWSYMEPRLRELTDSAFPIGYIGRPERASPAEGSAELHATEQARIITEAFADVPSRSRKRATRNGVADGAGRASAIPRTRQNGRRTPTGAKRRTG